MPPPNPSASGEKKNHGNVLLWAIWSFVGVLALGALVFVLVYENNTDKAARLQRQAESQIQENDFRSAQATLKQIPDGYAGNARPLIDQVNAELEKASERRKEQEKQRRIAEQRAEEERRKERIKKQEAERLAAQEQSLSNAADKIACDQTRKLFKKEFPQSQSVAERRRLANELVNQCAPALKPSFANFTGEGWDGALLAKGFEVMLLNAVSNNPQRHGNIFEVQAARDITAAGLRIDSCNKQETLNGEKTIFDILATDVRTGKEYNFEVKDWKKSSFGWKDSVTEMLGQLQRQALHRPNAIHVFYFNKAEKEIPDVMKEEIIAKGFRIIARKKNSAYGEKEIKKLIKSISSNKAK